MLERGADALLYVDPAPRGEWALALAALLPRREQLSFHLLATEEDVRAHPGLLERARDRLAGAAAVRDVVRPGPAEEAVVAEASTRPYALLVVPPAGRNAIQRMLKGSRVATVVRSVPAPVLVARRPPPRLRLILAAISGGPARDAVVATASELGAGLGAAVHYLHVNSEVTVPFAPEEAPQPASSRPDALAMARAALSARGLSDSLLVREGLVVDEVLEAFESGAYDLLVIGAGASVRGPFGSEDVAERILLGCAGSTLVVPPLERSGPAPAPGHA
jgi:nucleotide-binding universal stress UspA family protein